jgi:hypothetical protein
MISDTRQRYQAAREAIDGYRRANFLFGLTCVFIGSAALMIGAFFGYAGIVALSLPCYLVAGSFLFFVFNIRHFDNVKPFLCTCEGMSTALRMIFGRRGCAAFAVKLI